MLAIDASELSSAQSEFNQTLTDTATIKRNQGASDGQGGTVSTFNTVSTVACRAAMSQSPTIEKTQAGQIQPRVYYKIWFPVGTDVQAKDRVIIGSSTYEILGVNPGETQLIVLEAIAFQNN